MKIRPQLSVALTVRTCEPFTTGPGGVLDRLSALLSDDTGSALQGGVKVYQ
jgi:hypothetical protein